MEPFSLSPEYCIVREVTLRFRGDHCIGDYHSPLKKPWSNY